jgi:hypothetical protein
MTRSSREQELVRCSVSITPFSADASMGIMAQDHRPGEVRMYAPMMYRKARGGDLGNILVRGRNYMRGHVRARETDCGGGRAGARAAASTMSDRDQGMAEETGHVMSGIGHETTVICPSY